MRKAPSVGRRSRRASKAARGTSRDDRDSTISATPLARFILANDIKGVRLAEMSGISRQHIYRLKTGRMEPTRPVMVWLTEGACYLLKRRVEVGELFDLRIEINEEFLQ